MPSLESSIDDLYKGPLSEFVAARSRLAKTLDGADARRVKALKKPTIVPWAVSQVYWRARPLYERLAKSGAALRAAQIAALRGRSADVRGAADSHRQVVAEAVAEATRLASGAGAHPSAEALARMFEAVSLTPDLPDPPGRLVNPLAPPGFEALAGVAIKPAARARSVPAVGAASRPAAVSVALARRAVEETRRLKREEARANRQKRAAIEKAEVALRRASDAEARTRQAWERAQQARQRAANELDALRAK